MELIDGLLTAIGTISVIWFAIIMLEVMIEDGVDNVTILTAVIVLGIFILSLFAKHNLENVPTAMDVYQNKTMLEYKVVGDIKIDSCVIYKNKSYE